MHHFLNTLIFMAVFAVPVTNNVEYCICVHLSITVFTLAGIRKHFSHFPLSWWTLHSYFMSDVQNWKYLVMAPKRRDYGKGTRKGRKEDRLWDLCKSNSSCTYLPTFYILVYVHLQGWRVYGIVVYVYSNSFKQFMQQLQYSICTSTMYRVTYKQALIRLTILKSLHKNAFRNFPKCQGCAHSGRQWSAPTNIHIKYPTLQTYYPVLKYQHE